MARRLLLISGMPPTPNHCTLKNLCGQWAKDKKTNLPERSPRVPVPHTPPNFTGIPVSSHLKWNTCVQGPLSNLLEPKRAVSPVSSTASRRLAGWCDSVNSAAWMRTLHLQSPPIRRVTEQGRWHQRLSQFSWLSEHGHQATSRNGRNSLRRCASSRAHAHHPQPAWTLLRRRAKLAVC